MTKNPGVSNWHLNLLTTVKPSAPETKGILKNDGGKGGSGGGGDPGQPLKQGKTMVVSSGGHGASFLIKNENPGKSADEGTVVLKNNGGKGGFGGGEEPRQLLKHENTKVVSSGGYGGPFIGNYNLKSPNGGKIDAMEGKERFNEDLDILKEDSNVHVRFRDHMYD